MNAERTDEWQLEKDIRAAEDWFQQETGLWMTYLNREDRENVQDSMGHNLLPSMISIFRLYGHSPEKTARMAGLMKMLRCSGNLQKLVQDGMTKEGINRQVQYRVLISDQMMARALALLAAEEDAGLLPYFARLVIRVSEGMMLYLERNRTLNEEILFAMYAPWYGAAFYSAAALAGKEEKERKQAESVGIAFGMKLEAQREGIVRTKYREEVDWSLLPEGTEKLFLMEMAAEPVEKGAEEHDI